MNKFETIMLDILKVTEVAAETILPIVVKSASGTLILNASEEFAAGLAQAFAPPQAIPAAPAASSAANTTTTAGSPLVAA